jgi:hypothetical protein
VARITGNAGDVPAGARQTSDETSTDRIEHVRPDDWDGRSRLHGRGHNRIGPGDDDVYAKIDQICSKRGQFLKLAVSETGLDDDILANAVTTAP